LDQTTQSYTGKTEPVKWVRIHNLPDFVYFNHSQHVTVAGIECQHVTVLLKRMRFKTICSTNNGLVKLSQSNEFKMEGMNITLKFMMNFLKNTVLTN
jgi:hypothetical protein